MTIAFHGPSGRYRKFPPSDSRGKGQAKSQVLDLGILIIFPHLAAEGEDDDGWFFFLPIPTHPQKNHIDIYNYIYNIYACIYTLWLFNIAMENGPFIDGLPIKNGDFPIYIL